MPTPSSYPYGAHSAVLTLSFDLLQQVVQQYLFAGSRKPIRLDVLSRDGKQRYEAQLDRCSIKPAQRNQCALVFVFAQISTTGPRYNVGDVNLELACLVDLVQENDWGTEEVFLTFGHRLLVEQGLTISIAGVQAAWPYYPGVNQEATAALLPELERLVRDRLRINLCQLNGYAQAANDPAALWDATISAYRVTGGLQSRLDLYYQAAAGTHGYGPAPSANLPLDQAANAGLFIGNEHLLHNLVLPALEHLYSNPARPTDFLNPTQSKFRTCFEISAPAEGTSLGGLQATNKMLLKPLHANIGRERADGVSHFVNIGDLTVEINGSVRVTVIFTLMPVRDEPIAPDLLIKIKQTYTFSLQPMAAGLSNLVLENHDLRVWGVTTSTNFSAHAAAFVKREMERYVLLETAATVFSWAISLLPRFGPRRLPHGLGAAAPTAKATGAANAVPAVPAIPETATVTLPIYQVSQLEPFAQTTEPNTALPSAEGSSRRLLAAAEPSQMQSFSVDLRRCEAVVELNRLLVERKTTENVWLDFYSTSLRRLLGQLMRASRAPAAANYLLGFVSHYWLLNCNWKTFLLKGNNEDLTINALLARQFYGNDYLERSLLEQETQRGLQGVVDTALHPLLRTQHSTLLSATLRADGLYAQFSCQAADVKAPIGPVSDIVRPAPEVPSSAENKRYERLARRNTNQLQRDLKGLAEDFQGFWTAQPDPLAQELAQEREKAKHQVVASQKACLRYLAYAIGKLEENGHQLTKADELTKADTTVAVFSAASRAATGLDQAYRALQNDALLRLQLGSRWEQPAIVIDLHSKRITGFVALVQRLYADATAHPTHGWGKDDSPPGLASLIGGLPQWLASLEEEAKTLVESSRAFNNNMYLDSRMFQAELANVTGLYLEADGL